MHMHTDALTLPTTLTKQTSTRMNPTASPPHPHLSQDYIRTGTYHAAITENRKDFEGRRVMDVGCGSGILSMFAAQAGAERVYAVEASE